MSPARLDSGEGGAAWLRTELEAKSTSDLRRLCAYGMPQQRDGFGRSSCWNPSGLLLIPGQEPAHPNLEHKLS